MRSHFFAGLLVGSTMLLAGCGGGGAIVEPSNPDPMPSEQPTMGDEGEERDAVPMPTTKGL